MSDKEPRPGSKEAQKSGCLCPVMKNNYGKGVPDRAYPVPVFVVRNDCPLHGDWLERLEAITGRKLNIPNVTAGASWIE